VAGGLNRVEDGCFEPDPGEGGREGSLKRPAFGGFGVDEPGRVERENVAGRRDEFEGGLEVSGSVALPMGGGGAWRSNAERRVFVACPVTPTRCDEASESFDGVGALDLGQAIEQGLPVGSDQAQPSGDFHVDGEHMFRRRAIDDPGEVEVGRLAIGAGLESPASDHFEGDLFENSAS